MGDNKEYIVSVIKECQQTLNGLKLKCTVFFSMYENYSNVFHSMQ